MIRAKKQDIFRNFKSSVSIVLASVVFVTSFVVFHIAEAKTVEADSIKVYYPLSGAVDENGNTNSASDFVDDFYKTSDWCFQGKDFGSDASVFNEYDADFKKPQAVVSQDGKRADINWEEIAGADSYQLTVFNGKKLLSGSPFSTAGTSIIVDNLNQNSEYFIQIVAYNNGSVLKSSQIGSFIAYDKVNTETLLIKGDSKIGTANFTGIKEFEDGNKALYYTSPTNSYISLVLGSGNTLDLEDNTEAFAFRFGQEAIDSNNDKWLSMAFKPTIDTTDNGSFSGNTVTMYYVTDDGEVYDTVNNGNTRFNSLKYPQISQGWVIIPASLFKSDYFTDEVKHRFILTVEQLYEMSYDAVTDTYTKSSKQVSFDGYNIYISDFYAISDMKCFLKSLTYKGSEFQEGSGFVYDCNIHDTDTNTLINNLSGSGYTYGYSDSDKARATLSYKLKVSGGHNYGMSLAFNTPADGIYDLTNYLKVENCRKQATIYYHVLKEDLQGNTENLWPTDSEWYEIACNANNRFNPGDALECVEAELKQGELLRIEAYAEFSDGSDGEIDMRLSNTALTMVETETFEGITTFEYRASTYTDYFRNETLVNTGYYYSGSNRYNISAIELGENNSQLDLTKYIPYEGYFTSYQDSGIGYYTSLSNNIAGITTQTNLQYGIRFDYLSSKTGKATISFDNEVNKESKFRVLNNGKQIYPSYGWSEDTGNISHSFEIFRGDTVSVEQYSDTQTLNTVSLGNLKITIEETANISNIPGSNYYSALWTRPYNGRVYNGDFDQSENIWGFNLVDKNLNVCSGDTFSSQNGGLVYNKSMGTDTGYIFEDSHIVFKTAVSQSGASLSFKAPETGYYDFNYAMSIISGEGELEYRLRLEDKGIYPETGWEILPSGERKTILNDEIYLKMNETLSFEIYVSALEQPMEISLGSPMVLNVVSVTPNANGNTASYMPSKYLRMESGYNGMMMLDGQRFRYEIISNGLVKVLDTADYRNRILKNAETGVGFRSNDDEFSICGLSSNTARINYTSVRAGNTKIVASPSSVNNFAFTVRKISVDEDELLFNGTDSNSYDVDVECSLQEGDAVVIEISGADEINLGYDMAICIDGVYSTVNAPDSNVFIASLDYPYGEENYIGDYNSRDSIWNFNVLEVSDDSIHTESVNYYDSTDNKHLYHNEKKSGYYFKDKLLYADITEKTGISLEFKAPYSEIFEFSTGLKLKSTNEIDADIYVRVLKNDETIWPADEEWYIAEKLSGKADIAIPIQYLTLIEDDIVSLQVYAGNISGGEIIKIELAYPHANIHSPQKIANHDFSAKIFSPLSYAPFSVLDYDTGYALDDIPITQSIWNFEFINLLESDGTINNENPKEITANNYKHQVTNDIISYKNGFNNPNYMVYSSTMELRVFTGLNKNTYSRQEMVGESLRFVSPEDCDVLLMGAPSLSKELLSGQKAYFRILVNDETVYPLEDWEIFEGDKKCSDFKELELTLNAGDEIKYQFYTDASDADLMAYSNKSCNQIFVFSPSVTVIESAVSEKSNFNFVNDMSSVSLQISPFWKTQYTTDINNPIWMNMETYHSNWKYWLSSSKSYLGISPTGSCEFWLSNNNLGENSHPGIAVAYMAHATGYMRFNDMAVKVLKPDVFVAGQFRITKNGETIYPDTGTWQLIDDETFITLENISFAIEKDDEIRFEVTTKDPLETGKQLKIVANPKFAYSKYDKVYSEDKDIFGMLDKEMYQYFKDLESSEFDPVPALSQSVSSQFLSKQETLRNNWLSKLFDLFNDNTQENQNQIKPDEGTEGYYIEGTPDTIIKRRKKIITTISGGIPTYIVIILCVGAVLVLTAVITFLSIFIKRKNKRKVNQQ